MPYTIKKNNKGEQCVHKADADGNAIGESLGCHETKKEAVAQIGAIESEEKRRGKKTESANFNFYIQSADEYPYKQTASNTWTNDDANFIFIESDSTIEFPDKYVIYPDNTEKRQYQENVGGGVDVDKLKDSDFVLPKERAFPVVTPGDVKDAVNSWGRYKGKTSFETFKRNLIRLAKRKGESFVSQLPKEWREEMKKNVNMKAGMKFDSEEEAKEAAEELGCSGAHEMPDGSYMPCSKHEEFVELSGEKSVSVNADTLNKYLDDENNWLLEIDSSLIKSIINQDVGKLKESDIDSRFAVKVLGTNRLGAYGVLWGDEDSQDLHDEHFTKDTKDLTAIFDAMGKIPLVVHHAADDHVKTFVYGEVDIMEMDEVGLWYEAKIKEFETYRRYVMPFLEKGILFSSSGTLPAAKRVRKSGEITRWPIAEMTTTWMPAEYRMLEHPVNEIKSFYKEIGLEDCDLSEYDNETEEKNTKGVEKAQRLKALVEFHLSELGLLEVEI